MMFALELQRRRARQGESRMHLSLMDASFVVTILTKKGQWADYCR